MLLASPSCLSLFAKNIPLEHQSTPDKDMAMRLLECWPPLARKFSSGKVPIILSFVLYHNSAEWKSPKSIADAFIDVTQFGAALKNCFLIDLIRKSTQSLKEQGKASLVQMVLARQPSGTMIELLQDVKPDMGKLRSCCQEAAFAYMEFCDLAKFWSIFFFVLSVITYTCTNAGYKLVSHSVDNGHFCLFSANLRL